MGDHVSCNAPFDPPPDFSVDKADMVETITQVRQFINNSQLFKCGQLMVYSCPIGNKTRVLYHPLHVALLLRDGC